MEQISLEQIKKTASNLEFFIVINSSGQFFRAKRYGGYGNTWVDDIKKAKVYGKISQARARTTWFFNTYPQYPPPSIIKLGIGSIEILDETERVKKASKTKEEKEALRAKKRAQDDLDTAKRNFDLAQDKLNNARSRVNQAR